MSSSHWKKNYLLKESQALTGYENLDSQLTFSFNPNEGSGATTWTVSPSNNYVADYEINDYTITLKVKNQAITKLPETGGNSRMLFFLSGLTIIFIALGAFYLENKRVKN